MKTEQDKEIETLKRFASVHLGHCHMMCGNAHMNGSSGDPKTANSIQAVEKSAAEWDAFQKDGTIPQWMQ